MAFKMIAKSPLTKKLVSALKHKPWAAAHKERAAHPNTAEAHGAPVKLKKKKKEFVPAYPGADISKAEYDKARKAGVKSEAEYAEYKAKMKKKKKSPAKLKEAKNKRQPQPVRKRKTLATGAKGLPSSEYLKKREGAGPRSELYDPNTIPYGISPTKLKKPTKAKKKTNTVGTGFMNPPYKDTVKGTRPYAKRQGYHGYKDFKSILKK
jgi:hypothetical protein